MRSFRCCICLDSMDSASKPMTTLCGHIYCLDCATFQFTRDQPSCAVCRKPQDLDKMIRLFPDWENENTRNDASSTLFEDALSSSPVSVRSIEHAAEEAVVALKYAIADRQQPKDALLTCNTFMNAVTDRERPHINTELLREISFQLNLMSTKMKDDTDRLGRLKQNAQSARASETRLNLKVDKQRTDIGRLEKRKARLESEKTALEERVALLEQQCYMSSEDAGRQRFATEKAMNELEAVKKEKEEWKEHALKAKKKYHALKNKIEDTKRAALLAQRGRSQDTSDDLLVVG